MEGGGGGGGRGGRNHVDYLLGAFIVHIHVGFSYHTHAVVDSVIFKIMTLPNNLILIWRF